MNPWELDAEESEVAKFKRHRLFWAKLRSVFQRERPAANPGSSAGVDKGGWPLIVVQYSYAFDAPFSTAIVDALSQELPAFRRRVVLVAIESQLHEGVRRRVGEAQAQDVDTNGLHLPHPRGSFRILTVPYPVGVTAVPPRFPAAAVSSETTSPETTAARSQPGGRPILALFMGSLERGRGSNLGREGLRNALRPKAVAALRHFAAAARPGGAVASTAAGATGACVPGLEAACVELLKDTALPDRLWALPARSVFCVEPPGDTLTRAHFYVAVATGCVPVIFDGGDGTGLYHGPTFWPWRLFDSYSSTLHTAGCRNATAFDGGVPCERGPAAVVERGMMRNAHAVPAFGRMLRAVGLNYSAFSVVVPAAEVLAYPDTWGEGPFDHPKEEGGDEEEEEEARRRVRARTETYVHRLAAMSSRTLGGGPGGGHFGELASLRRVLDEAAPRFFYAPAASLSAPRQDDAFAALFAALTSMALATPRRVNHFYDRQNRRRGAL